MVGVTHSTNKSKSQALGSNTISQNKLGYAAITNGTCKSHWLNTSLLFAHTIFPVQVCWDCSVIFTETQVGWGGDLSLFFHSCQDQITRIQLSGLFRHGNLPSDP